MIVLLLIIFLLPCPANFWSINNFLITSGHISAPLLPSIQSGIQVGLFECQKQFKHSLWNCPTIIYLNLLNPSRRNNLKVTKEVAFIQAIVNAAIVHTIATTCQNGQHNNCSCRSNRKQSFSDGQSSKDNFSWLGCTEAVKFAMKTTSAFMDKKEGSDTWASVNTHNSQVGREMVARTMRKVCRCHGLSGSCNLKSCWWKVNDFPKIGKRLKSAYMMAKKLDINNMLRADGDTKNNLIYFEESPNYCFPNQSFGSIGTVGRTCADSSSCDEFCSKCGYHITKQLEKKEKNCNCKFNWCCSVSCEPCPPKTISICSEK